MKRTILIILAVIVIALLILSGNRQLSNNNNNDADNTPGATSSNSPVTLTYSLSEVATHNTREDCWMVLNGQVLNVTDFIPRHPGGEVILQGCGKDATSLFATQGGRGTTHSENAVQLTQDYVIGKVSN